MRRGQLYRRGADSSSSLLLSRAWGGADAPRGSIKRGWLARFRRYDAPLQRFCLEARASLPGNEHPVGVVRPAAAEQVLRRLREPEDVLARQSDEVRARL